MCGFVRDEYILKPAGPRLGCRVSGLLRFAVPGAAAGSPSACGPPVGA